MKNFLVIVVNLSVVGFGLAAAGTFLNYLFGLSIGFKGTKLPNDPVIGIVFAAIAAICGAAAYFVNKKTETAQAEES